MRRRQPAWMKEEMIRDQLELMKWMCIALVVMVIVFMAFALVYPEWFAVSRKNW